MSQGKLNAIPPGTGGLAGQLANSQTSDAIAQQGMASGQTTPLIGTLPGTFGRPGGSVQQPTLGQFGGFGSTPGAQMPMPVAPGSSILEPNPADQLDGLPGPDDGNLSQGY